MRRRGLIEKGANFKATDSVGSMPLYLAKSEGYTTVNQIFQGP